MTNVFSLPISKLAEKIRKSEMTSLELCEHYISQVNKFEKDVKAWAFFDKKLLLEKAQEADTYRKSGKPMGLLHGVPVALKDIIGTYDTVSYTHLTLPTTGVVCISVVAG